MNYFCRNFAAVIHEDCLLCKCFHILTFVELSDCFGSRLIREKKPHTIYYTSYKQVGQFPFSRARPTAMRRSALNLVKSISNTPRVERTPVY